MLDKTVICYSDISRYRSEIMGFAIIGVMIAHIITISQCPTNTIVLIINLIATSIFTRGFLFISGLSQYNSFENTLMQCKNKYQKRYYIKKVKRLLVPYILISFPYFFVIDIIQNGNVIDFVMHISTLSFWCSGNYSGMWYISVTVLLYFLYPYIHKLLFNSQRPTISMIIMIATLIALRYIVQIISIDYYHDISIGISQIPMFILGAYCMLYIKSNYNLTIKVFSTVLLATIAFRLVINFLPFFKPEFDMFRVLTSIIVFCFILKKFDILLNKLHIPQLLQWFGQYTLELYMVHLLVYYMLNNLCGDMFSEIYYILIGVAVAITSAKPLHYVTNKLINEFEHKES